MINVLLELKINKVGFTKPTYKLGINTLCVLKFIAIYTIVNGPKVMSCSADPIVTANFHFIYDDAEATERYVEVGIDDIIRIKYMGGEYSPVVLEAEGRLDKFSVLKDRNGKVFASNPIIDTLGKVKTLELDVSTEGHHNVLSIPVAAVRELEVIRRAGDSDTNNNGNTKPDCDFPGVNCPNNSCCTCPGYVQPTVDCPDHDKKDEIDIDGDGIIDVFIDDSGITEEQLKSWIDDGYVCVYKGVPYKDLQDAIDNVVCPCVDTIMDAIVIFKDILNEEPTVYTVVGPCIIRSIAGKTIKIVGAFNVNSVETVLFYDLTIMHSGVGKELVAIDSVNASVSIQKCDIILHHGYEITDSTIELPMAIRVTRLAGSTKGYEAVYVKGNTFWNYPEVELNGAHSTAICFTRNFGDVYEDFPYTVLDNTVGKNNTIPHILFADQNFNKATDDSALECSGIVYTKEGLKDLLKYQGADTYIDVAGIVDLDIETFPITVSNESRLVITGVLNLGTNQITNFGKVCNSGIVTGGTIINNGEITYCASPEERWIDFYNTKVRSNGSQKLLKNVILQNEFDSMNILDK